MAHASLGGVGLGAYFGFPPLWGATLFALGSGLCIRWLSGKRTVREDAAIAMLWTFGMALGILFAYLTPGFMTDLPSYLFGNILSISTTDLLLLGSLTLVTFLFYVLCQRAIICIACDRDFARTQGLPVTLIESILTLLTALTIVGCLHLVGIVMVISLLSVPQMTAALFVHTFQRQVLLSALFAYIGCVGGLSPFLLGRCSRRSLDYPCQHHALCPLPYNKTGKRQLIALEKLVKSKPRQVEWLLGVYPQSRYLK